MPENIPLTDLLSGGTNSLRTEVTNIPTVTNANIDIALSALRDAITKTGETVKTLADVVDKLSDVGVTSLPSLIAGSDIVGKVGIDQTTGGTTNGVVNKNASGNEIFTDASPGSMKLTGSNVEQTLNQNLPTKANLIGISDGTKIQAMTGNYAMTLLASAERTASTLSPEQTNTNSKGLIVEINVTVAGTGTLIPQLVATVNSQSHIFFVATTAISAVGKKMYMFYPGTLSAGMSELTETKSLIIPYKWQARIAHSDSSAWTYSVGAIYAV